MFEDADNFADIFRGGLPIYVLITIPLLLICSSNPVLASSEFNVQRMTQYDLHGNPLGKLFFNFCRANIVNFFENFSQTLSPIPHFYCRLPCLSTQFGSKIIVHLDNIETLHFHQVCHSKRGHYLTFLELKSDFSFCRGLRFQDLTVEQFLEIRSKAGGLVVLLPECLSKLSAEQRQVSIVAERLLKRLAVCQIQLAQSTMLCYRFVAVRFSHYLCIHSPVQNSAFMHWKMRCFHKISPFRCISPNTTLSWKQL